jgi:uncharacterized membrane protein required for colicin V production
VVLAAARSGWRRGFVFYVIDLVGFVLAVLVAIRFHEIPATVIEGLGPSPRTSAIVGGLLIFIPLIVVTAFLGSKAHRAVFKPGLFTTNRVLGAAFGAALAAAIVIVGLLFARSANLPFGIGDQVRDSTIAPRVLDAVEPGIAWIDDRLGLDLCGGRLARVVPEVCKDD